MVLIMASIGRHDTLFPTTTPLAHCSTTLIGTSLSLYVVLFHRCISLYLVQYRLEVQDGKLVWFHRNSLGNTLFSVTTDSPVLSANVWTHIVVTYTVVTGTAQIFINGDLIKQDVKDAGVPLSTDWEGYAGKRTLPTVSTI
jgi:hypothetical protein